ncbi:hypothetical protein ECDEC13C_1840 [Escherichia coli DEC13C]|nr:hypothetical protein ECDEC13C_1840 [Escherichia coli DEC13C]
MKKNPQKIAPVPTIFCESMKALTARVDVDLDAPFANN